MGAISWVGFGSTVRTGSLSLVFLNFPQSAEELIASRNWDFQPCPHRLLRFAFAGEGLLLLPRHLATIVSAMIHPLDGPRLKVRRAKGEVQSLHLLEESFRRDANYQLVRSEFNITTGKYAYRVSVGRQPDTDWGVYIGEIAHNLRSALDGLVYQLVLLNRKTPTNISQFPIFLVGRTKKLRPGKRRRLLIPHFEGMDLAGGRAMIHGVRTEHQARIEGLQPYKRRNRHALAGYGRGNALYLLKELNNADKHRLLQVVGAKPGALTYGHWGDPMSGITDVSGPGFIVLEDGAVVFEAGPGVHVNANLTPLVAFWQGCKAVENKGVVHTLSIIAKHVELIIEDFASDFP